MCFCFVGLPFFPSASWPLSFLSLFFLFLRPCLIHARMPEIGVGLLCMDTLLLHSWSGSMTVVVGLLHGATFLSGLPLLLFVLSRWNVHSFKPTSRPCVVLLPVVLWLSCIRRDISRSEALRTTHPPITYLGPAIAFHSFCCGHFHPQTVLTGWWCGTSNHMFFFLILDIRKLLKVHS